MNCKCQLLARRPAHLSNSPTKDYVEHARRYENRIDVAPAGARQLVSSVRPTPNDAQLPTKPAGPKSELPTANRPVATSLFAVQFQQNHSLSSRSTAKNYLASSTTSLLLNRCSNAAVIVPRNAAELFQFAFLSRNLSEPPAARARRRPEPELRRLK